MRFLNVIKYSIIPVTLAFVFEPYVAHTEEAAQDSGDCISPSASEPANQLFEQFGSPVDHTDGYLLNSGLGIVETWRGPPIIYSRDETPELIGSSEFQESLNAQSAESGLWRSIKEVLRVPRPNNPNLSLVINSLCFDLQADRVVFTVTAKKSYSTEEGVRIGIWYRWEIAVRQIFVGGTDQKIGEKTFNLKLHARAPDLNVQQFEVGFDINHDDILVPSEIAKVKPFYKDGSINPLYAVLYPNSTDCIDIDISQSSYKEVNLGEVKELDFKKAPDRKEMRKIIKSLTDAKSGIQFCAGSCSGYMLAASNGG